MQFFNFFFYPLKILAWQPVVNDTFGQQPVVVTYDFLAGSVGVYDAMINPGQQTEFGTAGRYYQSNLVLYDRLTDSYWSQLQGVSLVGPLASLVLEQLPFRLQNWASWQASHPDGQVLSNHNGLFNDYQQTPIANYSRLPDLILPIDYWSPDFPLKEPVYGLDFNGQFKAYPVSQLQQLSGLAEDRFAGVNLEISYQPDSDAVQFINTVNSQTIVPFYSYWFAWVAQHPETEVFRINK